VLNRETVKTFNTVQFLLSNVECHIQIVQKTPR